LLPLKAAVDEAGEINNNDEGLRLNDGSVYSFNLPFCSAFCRFEGAKSDFADFVCHDQHPVLLYGRKGSRLRQKVRAHLVFKAQQVLRPSILVPNLRNREALRFETLLLLQQVR
jgi:hypothetical protein